MSVDNSSARQTVKDFCDKADLPCLHVGLAEDYSEVIWNQDYRVPSGTQDDVCDYPLARNLVNLAVAVACETLITFIAGEEQQNFTVTLRDFAIKPLQFLSV